MPLPPNAPVPNPLSSNDYLPTDATTRAWEARVDAGLIGARTGLSFDSRVRMMRNEVALFGRVVTRALERF